MTNQTDFVETPKKQNILRPWIAGLLLVYILIVGAYLRFNGLDWDEDQHLHPDERFLTMVSTSIRSIGTPDEQLGAPPSVATQPARQGYLEVLSDCQKWGGYFNTPCSPLNPNNRGYDFYVYGTLPLFVVRYVGEWVEQTGYSEIHLVGRALSAVMELLTVVLVFATGENLYNRRVGALAAAFAAVAVLPIQQSHFYTVDTFASFFMMLAFYAAARISTSGFVASAQEQQTLIDAALSENGASSETEASSENRADVKVTDSQSSIVSLPEDELDSTDRPEASNTADIQRLLDFFRHPLFWLSILFGVALGMAVASKINAAPIAIILPMAAGVYLLKLPPEEQRRQAGPVFIYMVIAGITSLVTFRVFQPYAFTGPGFFGARLNPAWIDDLRALRAQTSGDVDFPPALQWARRPLTFSWQNMVVWGLGLPLGILAWVGFAHMAWRMVKGHWQNHILLWGWTAAYFTWQSMLWNSTMRYQLPIYPLLAIIASWFVYGLYERGSRAADRRRGWRWLAIGLGAVVLIATTLWAYAFMGIYPKDHTRIAASSWLLQEMPGPVTLPIEQPDGTFYQPLPFYEGTLIGIDRPFNTEFAARVSGELSRLYLPHVVDQSALIESTILYVDVSYVVGDDNPLTAGQLAIPAEAAETPDEYYVPFDTPIPVENQNTYHFTLDVNAGDSEIQVCGPLRLQFEAGQGLEESEIYLPQECLGRYDFPLSVLYTPQDIGSVEGVWLSFSEFREPYEPGLQTLDVSLYADLQSEPVAKGILQADFSPQPQGDPRGESYWIDLDRTVTLSQTESYTLMFRVVDGPGLLTFSGAAVANESSWDDGLPLRIDGYDPFGGIYQGGLSFEMYWDDNQDKYERFVTALDQADYLLITSSRQWASTTRVPERYPLTSEYYRRLIGCPLEESIEWCYDVAEEGTFQGDLGFDLVKIFVSNPSVASFEINDQPSEEAFTVYDHPKVFVFKKSDGYNPQRVREILGAVDLSQVVHLTPKQTDSYPGDLMLPPGRLAEQRSGGTWSDLFDYESLQNKYPIIAVAIWYLAVSLVGWMIYPFVRYAMPGLADRGYPLIRIAGLIVVTYLAWLAGSMRIPFSRLTIGGAILLVALLGGALAYHQRDELRTEWREKRKYFLMVELLTLGFFVFGLLVRFGNPDLWHPWKGGEKPMDFSYFNAVLKSTSFPPYDPWFAGGYINYYYYGFVIVGVLVKFLGIVPSIAYNLILPFLFAMMAMGAFSVGWNLVWKAGGLRPKVEDELEMDETELASQPTADAPAQPPTPDRLRPASSSFIAGLIAAFGMAVMGNLGTLRMIFNGFKVLGTTLDPESASFFSRALWTVKGFVKALTGSPLPYRMDEWYWNPSRVIGAEHGGPITEFPYFTFLYGDLHAHLIALPIALLAIAWALSVVLGRAWLPEQNGKDGRESRRSIWQIGAGLLLGGLVIGALYPVNLSDIYTYLPLGIVALAYAIWLYGDAKGSGRHPIHRLIFLVVAVLGLTGLALYLYLPYSQWYGQGYSQIQLWTGTRTPVMDYLTHWGAFLFIFITWMIYETIDWMASTPVSALLKLKPYRGLILLVIALLAFVILVLGLNRYPQGIPPEVKLPLGMGVHVIWFVLPLAVWAGVLLLRPGTSDAKRFTLFLVGTGLVLTLLVETVVVSGDIGRMNTVFKFYLHVWSLFAVSAAAALIWMWQNLNKWDAPWRLIWQIGLIFFAGSTILYPLTATTAKIKDRMAFEAPHTLDGMAYMKYAKYFDEGVEMNLSQDYDAIHWMQENIVGSPVIVEANSVEYRWGTRYTIYTGLPGVVGWNWHQRQQRTLLGNNIVWDRVNGVQEFYETTDLELATAFLDQNNVSYIVLGQLEHAKYDEEGLAKFDQQNGLLWREIYRDQDTVIYEVIRE